MPNLILSVFLLLKKKFYFDSSNKNHKQIMFKQNSSDQI